MIHDTFENNNSICIYRQLLLRGTHNFTRARQKAGRNETTLRFAREVCFLFFLGAIPSFFSLLRPSVHPSILLFPIRPHSPWCGVCPAPVPSPPCVFCFLFFPFIHCRLFLSLTLSRHTSAPRPKASCRRRVIDLITTLFASCIVRCPPPFHSFPVPFPVTSRQHQQPEQPNATRSATPILFLPHLPSPPHSLSSLSGLTDKQTDRQHVHPHFHQSNHELNSCRTRGRAGPISSRCRHLPPRVHRAVLYTRTSLQSSLHHPPRSHLCCPFRAHLGPICIRVAPSDCTAAASSVNDGQCK